MLPKDELINLYHKQWGCNVIPLRRKSKKPALHQWRQWSNTRVSDEQLATWHNNGDFGNVGLVCGDISRLVVIDIDLPRVVDWLKLDFNNVWQAGAAVVQTGRGYHIYLRTNQHVDTKQLPRFGVEMRANGSYVLAPPSLHPSRRQYRWYETPYFRRTLNGKPPTVLRPMDAKKVWRWIERALYNEVGETPPSRTARYTKPKPDLGNALQRTPTCIQRLRQQGVGKGARNNAAYALASFYKQQGKTYAETLTLLRGWNSNNTPPLCGRELKRAIKSAYRRDKEVGCTFIRNRLGMGHACKECPLH